MGAIARITELVDIAIDSGDYSFIRKAMDIAEYEGIFMSEDDDFVLVEDEMFRFNGAF